MAKIRNINISFTNKEEEPAQETAATYCGSYSINIQASDDWIVIGKYRDNSLCALELKQISQTEAKG